MAAKVVLVVFALALSACQCAPLALEDSGALSDSVEGELVSLAGELRAVASQLHGISDSLVITPVSLSGLPDGVLAVPADVTLPLKPTEATTAYPRLTTPEGLPDNDELRRRLFFIGDLAEDFALEPARVLLPPHEDAVPDDHVHEPASELLPPTEEAEQSAGSGDIAVQDKTVTAPLNHATDGDKGSSRPYVHEKDVDLGSLLRRPGHRLSVRQRASAASRDEEIRTAMEESDVFQGPFPVQGVRRGRSMGAGQGGAAETKVKPGHQVYRWSVVAGGLQGLQGVNDS